MAEETTNTESGSGVSGSQQERLVMCRDYQTSVGHGFATLKITLPGEYQKADIADLRDWLKLIDRQLGRLEEQGT